MTKKYNTIVLWVLSILVVTLGISTLTLLLKQRKPAPASNEGATPTKVVAAEAAKAAAADLKQAMGSMPLTVYSLEQVNDYNSSLVADFYIQDGFLVMPTNGTPIKVFPEVDKLSWRVISKNRLLIEGQFKPATSYKVTFAKDWATSKGLSLAGDIERTIKTRALSPFLRIVNNGLFYPASRDGIKFPISSLGISKYKVSIYRAYDSNIPIYGYDDCAWFPFWADIFKRGYHVAEGFATVQGPSDCQLNSILDLSVFMTNVTPGFYCVKIQDTKHGFGDDCAFSLTDLAPQVFIEPNVNSKAVVFVTSLSEAKAVVGAKAIAYTQNHQIAGEGITDSRGVAIIKLDPRFTKQKEGISGVEVRTTNDFTFVDLGHSYSRMASSEGRSYNQPFALVFSEREMCRPGEVFESSVLVRTTPKNGALAMADAPVELALYDVNDNLIESRRLVTDKYGLASTSWNIPKDAEVGFWQVACKVASTTLYKMPIYVSAYVPDRFEVSLESSDDEVVGFDSAVSFIGGAKYYFGEPVISGDCSMTFIAKRARAPRHWCGWSVGTDAPFKQKNLKVEPEFKDGKFLYEYEGLFENSVEGAEYPISLLAVANVQEAGGRTVTSSDTVTYFDSDWYIGLRESKIKSEDSLSFEVALLPAILGTTNSTFSSDELVVSLARKEWKQHLETTDDSVKVVWREEIIKLDELSRRLSLAADNPASFTGRVDFLTSELKSGQYILTVKDGASLVSTLSFWHWSGEASERTQSIANLILTPAAPSFKPGDVAEVSFMAPRAGSLYVVAGVNGIDHESKYDAIAGKNTIKVPIPKDLIAGRYYIYATLVSDGALGSMRRLTGVVGVKVDLSQSRKLNLSLDFPEKVFPGETAKISISLKDGKGMPVGGVVKIGAIDEGVAVMSDFHVANLFKYFYGRDFEFPFSCHDIFDMLYPELKLLSNGAFGGDMFYGKAGLKRKDSIVKQKDTARLSLPAVYVSTNGVAVIDVKFPDHVGALRLTAVAANETSVGSMEDSIVLRNRISVLPTAPRFAVGGDSFRFTANLFNHELEKGEWTLTIKLPDGLLFDGKTEIVRKGTLEKGASCVETFDLVLAEDAEGVKEISIELSQGQDSVKEMSFITVRPKLAPVTSVEYLSITNGVINLSSLSDGWHKTSRSTIEVSSVPVLALAESLDWLSDYPYGCLEQTTSAAFPFLVAGDLVKLGVIDESLAMQANLKVKAAYALIMQMQCGDGAFAMWPGSYTPWVYGTIYANHFIFEAERMGLIKVNGNFYREEWGWLKNVAANASPANRNNRAYAIYALAVSGYKDFIISALNVIAQRDNDFAALVVSAAMMRFGYATEGIPVFEKAIAARAWETTSSWDRIKNLGMVLFMASKAGYRDYARLMPIMTALNNELRCDGTAWGTTRDNAWSVLGIASFAQAIGAKNGSGTIKIGAEQKSFDVASKPAVFTRDNDSAVQILSENPLFVKVSTVGIPKKPLPKNNPISITKTYLDESGKAVTKVRSGELVTAIIKIKSPVDIDRAVLVDLVPSGFELEDVSLATRSSIEFVIPVPAPFGAKAQPQPIGSSEIRDDRWLWFGFMPKAEENNSCTLKYSLRAIVPGTYSIPQIAIEDMYNPDLRGDYAPSGTIVIE